MRSKLRNIFVGIMLLFCISVRGQDTLAVKDSVRRPLGFDASNLVNAGRRRAQHKDVFLKNSFRDNMKVSMLINSKTPVSKDYGFANSAGLSVQKWFTPSVGMRVEASGGYMYENLYGLKVGNFTTKASMLFNMSSYIGGYKANRFCNMSLVAGVGYVCCWNRGAEHFFRTDLGINIDMKMAKNISVFVEPSIPLDVNSYSVDYGFATSVGISYDLSTITSEADCAGNYFLSLMGGLQFQNSKLVYESGLRRALGMHFNVGLGRRFTDYFALRASASYSRDAWLVYYNGERMPTDYYSLRLEGLFDVLRFVRRHHGEERFGAAVVFGPECGFMKKKDVGYALENQYVGLVGGLHFDCILHDRLRLFLEPRFSLIPYSAPNDDSTSFNVNRNYYDSLLNFNLGLEINL